MKSKKILSLMLALVMTMALAVPAFAAAPAPIEANVTDISKGANVKITGTTEAPTIKVKVPTTGGLIANPYELEVMPSEQNGLPGSDAITDVVISPVQYIESQSNIDLWVSGTVTGTPSTDVKLLATNKEDDDWAAASKTKDMFLYFQMAVATAAGTAPSWAALDVTAGSENGLVVAAKAVTIPANLAKTAKLEKVTFTDGEAQATSCVAFRLAGNLATNLSTGTWGTKDKVDVAIAFTFLPSEPAVS